MSNYLKAVKQPVSLRFEFRKNRSRTPFPKGADVPGRLYVVIRVGSTYNPVTKRETGVTYGPLKTNIQTTLSVWQGRYSKPLNSSVKAAQDELKRQLADVQTQLEAIHIGLERKANREETSYLLTGETIVTAWRSGQSPDRITLQRVYKEFLSYKLNMVQSNRRLRQPEQISQSTYNTYPKRWVLIQQFLLKRGEGDIPVGNIEFRTATDLKEWMINQKISSRNGKTYELATISKVIKLLKMLLTYAQGKGYIRHNVLATFSMAASSPVDPKPLTSEQMNQLEMAKLPPVLRHQCDSWLVAAELCLHYGDFMELPQMKFITTDSGFQFIQHQRVKQEGRSQVQTVNLTPRAIRLLEKYGGPTGLYCGSNAYWSKQLKTIARLADLRDLNTGEIMKLQFGQGRDTGLTQRAIDGANSMQLAKIAGWSKPVHAERYVGNALLIVEGFANSVKLEPESRPDNPFPFIYKAS